MLQIAAAADYACPPSLNVINNIITKRLDQEDIKKLGVGAIWSFAKAQGSFNLVYDLGHKGPVLRPRFIRPGRARTHVFYSMTKKADFFEAETYISWSSDPLPQEAVLWSPNLLLDLN